MTKGEAQRRRWTFYEAVKVMLTNWIYTGLIKAIAVESQLV
jgi:hypothetical protein